MSSVKRTINTLLATVFVLVGLFPSSASAHATYAYNTGWNCNQPWAYVPYDQDSGYVCTKNTNGTWTWYFSHHH